jgi:ribonuclease Y
MSYQPLVVAGILVLGAILGYFIQQSISAKRANSLENKLKRDFLKAENDAQEVILQAKNKAVSLLEEARREEKDRKSTIDRSEARIIKIEEDLLKKENEFRSERSKFQLEEKKIQEAGRELQTAKKRIEEELSKVAGLTPEEAKVKLISEMTERNKEELAQTLQKLFRERQGEVEKKALDVMTTAIQRYARSSVSDITTSTFNLPSADLKGKIIGREGRNIRTLERLTGVELIVDEAPDTIIFSSFDPLRREIAKITLEKLIKDGRIQPAKIEERVEETKAEMEKRMYEIGEEAAYELGIIGLPKEILHLLGRLNFRTSFGQNVLNHSIEMAHIAGMIASELGMNVEVVKKGALLHDIGKAIDHEVPGTHVELGRKILKKYGVEEKVISAMESHHDEYPFATPESYIVAAADILSAARPGARRGTLENYIKRLEDLEKIAASFDGVKNAYAISAGRELRVFVVPEKIDDFKALQLARDVAAKIEAELKYPGEIKVNVIREIRAVEYAR